MTDDDGSLWGLDEASTALARFPPGETVLAPTPLGEGIFAEVDRLLAGGACPEGRLEIETAETRLTCLIHQSAPYLAGLQERDVYSQVPLYDFADRARQLAGAACSLVRSDNSVVLMVGVHFCRRPYLQGSTRLVNPAHVLRVLGRQRQDAALALERSGTRTLLFLNHGQPARLFFGDPREDPGQGTLSDRLLLYAFADSAPPGKVEVFTSLKLPPDPDRGTPLAGLAEATRPCPPAMVHVRMADGREVRRRVFLPPAMIVGRDPTCNLFIDNLAVSRRHARLAWERGHFVIEDLKSANGTAVNGNPVTRAIVEPGDRVEIGKFEITLDELPDLPRGPETLFLPTEKLRTASAAAAPAVPRLVGEGLSLKLTRDVLIGRGEGVDATAKGFFVRPVHARVFRGEKGKLRLACFGRGTVRVNGRRLASADLGPGDVIVVGRSAFRLVSEPEERPVGRVDLAK